MCTHVPICKYTHFSLKLSKSVSTLLPSPDEIIYPELVLPEKNHRIMVWVGMDL